LTDSIVALRTFPCATVEDIDVVCALFERVAAHPSYLKVNGKALVSTFSGECSLFGHGSFVEAWSTVKRRLEITAEVSMLLYLIELTLKRLELGLFCSSILH
jgi:hypothetical protein